MAYLTVNTFFFISKDTKGGLIFFQFANRYKQAMVRFLFLLISVSLLVYQANAQTDGNPHVGGYLRNSMWVIINYQSLSSLFLYNSLTELGPQKAM